MARHSLSRMGWWALGAWAVASTAALLALRDHEAEQARRLEALEQVVSELRQSRGTGALPGAMTEEQRPSSQKEPGREEAPAAALSEQEVEALAERVAALLDARQPGPPGTAPHVTHASRGPAQQAALQRAQELVEQVMARGRLSQEDVLDIRHELAPIEGTPEAEALRKRLVVALNLGKLIPDNPREPLLP